jgi:hypothetical protein
MRVGEESVIQTLSASQTRHLRLRAQRLAPADRSAETPDRIVAHLGGVQAQEAEGAILAIGIRGRALVASQIEGARLEERSIVRTWGFRGTLHLVAAADLGWLLPLLGPVFVRKSQRRYAELALTEARYADAARLIRASLHSHGPLTRSELAEQLAGRGVSLEGQALYHTLRRAGLEGAICFGPDRDGEPAYVLLDEWVATGPPLGEGKALAALTRRYLRAYGPARPEDLAAWSGLSLRRIRARLEEMAGELLAVEVGGSEAWMLDSHRDWLGEPAGEQGVVRLLPAYDPYLLGYRSRETIISPAWARRIHPGGGFFRPAVIVDGWAAGTWRSEQTSAGIEVTVAPFEPLSERAMSALEAEVEALGRFYEAEVVLTVEDAAEQNP